MTTDGRAGGGAGTTRDVRPTMVLKTGEAIPPVRARYGDFEDWIAKAMGRRVDSLRVVSVFGGAALPDPSEVSGVVVTGSPAMVSERAHWSERAAQWLAEVVLQDATPVLGLCYGHQLIAHGLGGEVGPNPRGREMGTLEIELGPRAPGESSGVAVDAQESGAFAPLFEAGIGLAHFSHVESVLRPPAGARVLGRTRLDPHSVLAFGPRQWGVQFHPEFDRDVMRGYVEARRQVLIAEGLDPDALLASAVETPWLASVLRRFAGLLEVG